MSKLSLAWRQTCFMARGWQPVSCFYVAEKLRNALVYVPTADRPALPAGEYYHHQLLGLRVTGEDGNDLGRLTEILSTAAHDIYVVRSESGAEILLPAIDEVILEIDLDNGLLRVHLLPGLI